MQQMRKTNSVVGMFICCALVLSGARSAIAQQGGAEADTGQGRDVAVHLWKTVHVPKAFRSTKGLDGAVPAYGGDVRIGDLRNQRTADFLVYRSAPGGHRHGGVKPVFLGAFDQAGNALWHVGSGGVQPTRPGPVAIHDIDGDGRSEVIHYWKDQAVDASPRSLGDVAIQIREGATGELEKQARPSDLPETFRHVQGGGPTWAHQRILICNLRGQATPRDFIVSAGGHVFAFDQDLNALWSYEIDLGARPNHASYIPAVGDIDGDGRDEVTGGRYLLDDDGSVMYEDTAARFTPHMDSARIAQWDNGRMRVIGSGGGHVIDAHGNAVLSLGKELVPHGQEVRVGRFKAGVNEPQMVIRWTGHGSRVMTVDVDGKILKKFALNNTPNQTGMDVVYWHGHDRAALICNGGYLWDPIHDRSWQMPDLPPRRGHKRAGWYHCIPADLNGDGPEEVVLYNPWDETVHLYGSTPPPKDPITGYNAGPRQYNVRLMD